MKLKATKLRSLKPKQRGYKTSDGGGLYVWVAPSGTRTWRMDYRFAQKAKTLTLGKYPQITLAEARRLRDEAKTALARGEDPSEIKRLEKLAEAVSRESSFNALSDEYLDKLRKEARAEQMLKKVKWLLDFAKSDLGNRPVSGIS